MAPSRLQIQQGGTAGDTDRFPGSHHGLADARPFLLRAEGQNAWTGSADGAAPGSRLESGLAHLLPSLDQAPPVGLMQPIMHAIGDQIAVACAKALQELRNVGYRRERIDVDLSEWRAPRTAYLAHCVHCRLGACWQGLGSMLNPSIPKKKIVLLFANHIPQKNVVVLLLSGVIFKSDCFM